MTLHNVQSERAYPAVNFGRPRIDTRQVAQELQRHDQRFVVFAGERLPVEDTDSGVPSFDDLLARLEPLRRRLAVRRIKGETLAPDEQLVLSILNHRLAELLPPPAPLPAKVADALLEAQLLLRRYSGG